MYIWYIHIHFFPRKIPDIETPNSINADAVLWINMSSVHYIHTKRFIVELHLFVKELLQLQTVIFNPFLYVLKLIEIPFCSP